jgi:hypothetical protein
VAWGANFLGQTNVPAGLNGVTAIAAWCYHTLALKDDGTVVAWEYNNFGQTSVPAGLTGVTAVAAGCYHSIALKDHGTVVAWGYNGFGQTSVPAGLTGVAAIAGGAYHSLALKDDGTVVAWGDNSGGQTNVPPGLNGVTAIAGGASHSLALKEDGTVVAWGSNDVGQTNVPADLTGVAAIAAGYYHSLALKEDGTVMAWGSNDVGQTNVPDGLTGVTAIASGLGHNLAVISGDITPPVISAPTGLIVDATSPAGTVVGFTATATDQDPPNPAVTCTPPSGSVFPIGDTLVECNAEDAAGNMATASFTVHVRGAPEQVADLIALVDSYNLRLLGTALHEKLDSVQGFLAANKPRRACAVLDRFLAQVREQRGKRISVDQADRLILDARRIKAVIAC